MIYHTSRSDLEPHIKAAHEARSRAFFDLLTWMRRPLVKAWSQIKLALSSWLSSAVKSKNRPSGALHA